MATLLNDTDAAFAAGAGRPPRSHAVTVPLGGFDVRFG
jgi:hypothetical protein